MLTTKDSDEQCKHAGREKAVIDVSGFPKTLLLFFATALAELLGCYLPMLWLSGKGGAWLTLPAAASLCLFVWLLTLHPAASGRVYATYGAVYIATALLWLWAVDGMTPSWSDMLGVGLALAGAGVIALGQKGTA